MALPKSCPLCGSSIENQNPVTKHVFGDLSKQKAFFKCNDCKVHYLYPRLDKNEEKKFYASEFESFMEQRSGKIGGWDKANKHIEANKSTYNRRYKYLKTYLKNGPKSILEFGCSSGFMLFPMINDGHLCEGIEPSGVFNEFLRQKGVSVFDSLESLKLNKPSKKYDLIFHFFVLEHIVDPLPFLSDQLSLLNPGGKIILKFQMHQIHYIPYIKLKNSSIFIGLSLIRGTLIKVH